MKTKLLTLLFSLCSFAVTIGWASNGGASLGDADFVPDNFGGKARSGATPFRKLNNFVSEIFTKPLRNGTYEFTLEKAGWVYIALDRPYTTVLADVDRISAAIRYRWREPSETQRYLSAGRHVVTVRGVDGESEKGTISVRLVKTISISGYKHIIDPSGDYPRWGYSLEYYRRFGLFGTCNTIELDARRLANPRAVPVIDEVHLRGIKILSPGGPVAEEPCRDEIGTMAAAVQKNPAWAKNRLIMIDENVISGWEFPGCFITRGRPDVDLRAFYARLVRMLATDPAFAEIGGIGIATPICDEDLFRFSFSLFHHYCLEGRTDDFAGPLGLKLFPGHLVNGDFDGGLSGWTASGTGVTVVAKPGFAKKHEVRILDSASKNAGRDFCVMTANANGSNAVRQTLRDLIPGHLYQITFVSVMGEDLDDPGVSRRLEPAVACRVEGAEEIRDLDHVVRMCGKGNGFKKGSAGVFVHRRVFRATAKTAELVMTDWSDAGRPLGAPGSRVAFHYVGCDGFFVRDDTDLAALRDLNRANTAARAKRDPAADAAWEKRRAAAVNRPRGVVYNTDGCDALYWKTNMPVTIGNFTSCRLVDALHTRITTLAYCPQSAGFGHFTCGKAGELMTGTVPHPNGDRRNIASDFIRIGTDPLEMASRFAATNGLEFFVSVRVNDQHDAVSVPGKLSALYPQFKLDYPECLMGSLEPSGRKGIYKGYAGWSCVNFDKALVRERMKTFVRDLVTNYDVDGIEYDFNRHFMLFQSVAKGGHASAAEIAEMTVLMRELKAITEEVARRKNRPIVIAVRMPDSLAYDLAVGADLETWMKEKLLDLWIGGGYFLLNPLEKSVALAHRYGIKFYWSLDETRIPGVVKKAGLPHLRGRQTPAFYAARLSAARAAGCDGVYFFNIENGKLHEVASLDETKSAKYYFAVDRGSGGYTPQHWLDGGMSYNNLPPLDPGHPHPVKPGETVAFEMYFGDDFSADPKVTAAVSSPAPVSELKMTVNGAEFVLRRNGKGDFTITLPPTALKKGTNAFAVTFPETLRAGTTFNDFSIRVLPKGVPERESTWSDDLQ